MSFKADALLKKATTFERLALYGNRKEFLTALAQDPGSTLGAYHGLDSAVKQLDAAIKQFINGPAEVQPDLPGGRMKGLPSSLANAAQIIAQVSQSGNDADTIPQVLSAAKQLATARGMGPAAQQAWIQAVLPLATSVIEAASNMPAAQSALEAQPDQVAPVPSMPGAVKPAGISISPSDLHDVQDFINKEMIAKFPPIAVDGKWGPETARLVREWGDANGLRGQALQNVVEVAKDKAGVLKGAPSPGLNLQQYQNTI